MLLKTPSPASADRVTTASVPGPALKSQNGQTHSQGAKLRFLTKGLEMGASHFLDLVYLKGLDRQDSFFIIIQIILKT